MLGGCAAHAATSGTHKAAPFEITETQYIPVSWAQMGGWAEDNHLSAFGAFRTSCRAIGKRASFAAPPQNETQSGVSPKAKSTKARDTKAQDSKTRDSKALAGSLDAPCRAATHANITSDARARAFFERHFRPVQIAKLGETAGFVTGYFEPIVDGSRTRTDVYTVPVYRRPSNLFVRGFSQSSPSLPNRGEVFRKIGRRKLVPYYDRAEIEDGAIAGRGLELAWLKNQTDLMFIQIQGSARVQFEDGTTLRINYDSHNGHGYTPVGRILIERNIIPREQMSMQKIREWMAANPDGAEEVRRQNRGYVFFRSVNLGADDEPAGAQGVPLTPGRSIAVDRMLHVYGTPFFIAGDLPITAPQKMSAYRRLMVAQDTGSAIVGPARADIYFGAGKEAGLVSGRLRHPAQFVMLVPTAMDPVARGKAMPLPKAKPKEKSARRTPRGKKPPHMHQRDR